MLDKRQVAARMAQDRALGMAFGKMMANRYRHFARLTFTLGLHCVRARVADALLYHAGVRGETAERGVEMDLDLTQELFASCLGTDRAVLARTLLQFEREGILQARGKHVTLFDLSALKRIAMPQDPAVTVPPERRPDKP
jgi:CRP/FNR family transcriptional regulator